MLDLPPGKDPCCSSSSSERIFAAESWTLENRGFWQREKQDGSVSCNTAAPAIYVYPSAKSAPEAQKKQRANTDLTGRSLLPHPLPADSAMFCSSKAQTVMFLVLSLRMPPLLLLWAAALVRIWHASWVCWCCGQLPFPATGFLRQLLCIAVFQHVKRAARQTGVAKVAYLLLFQSAEREPQRSHLREMGWWWGFYCPEAPDPDLPSTSPDLE